MTLTMSCSGAGLAEQQVDVGHGLLGLRGDVAHADVFRCVEVLPDLPAQVDGVAGDDGLAQVVVQVLFGVGVAGVERADTGVRAHARRRSLLVRAPRSSLHTCRSHICTIDVFIVKVRFNLCKASGPRWTSAHPAPAGVLRRGRGPSRASVTGAAIGGCALSAVGRSAGLADLEWPGGATAAAPPCARGHAHRGRGASAGRRPRAAGPGRGAEGRGPRVRAGTQRRDRGRVLRGARPVRAARAARNLRGAPPPACAWTPTRSTSTRSPRA